MAQSSIHIEKVTTGSFLHNDRTMMPSYLIDDSTLNECSRSSQESLEQYYKLKAEAEHNYTERTGQKMQKSTVLLKEAIVNLEAHHTLKDLQPIIKELEGYGFTVLQSAIHRDEGFLNDDTKEKNYHAHITMFNLDPETGKSVKLGKNYRQELSKLQTITANVLGMERGKVSVEEEAKKLGVEVEKASKRLGTHTYKRAMVLKENATKELTQEIKAKDYTLKEMQSRIVNLEGANTELRKELHAQNRDINKTQDLEEKERKITELEAKLTEIEGKNTKLSDSLEASRSLRVDDKQKISELTEQVIAKDQAIDQLKEAQPEPINASLIVQLQDENKILKITNKALETEVSELKQNRAAVEIPQGDIEQIEEVKKLKQITLAVPNTDERNALAQKLQKENAIDEIKKSCYKKVEEKGLIYTTTKTVLDKDVYIEKLEEREKDHQKLHSFNDRIIVTVVDKMKTIVEMSKTALEAVKSKFMGKSIDGTQKERTEPKLSNTDKIRGFVDQLKEPEKQKSQGMER
jgi:hypothetical protein